MLCCDHVTQQEVFVCLFVETQASPLRLNQAFKNPAIFIYLFSHLADAFIQSDLQNKDII